MDIADCGREFGIRSRGHAGLRKMRDKACYYNAWRVADREPDQYRYAEGLAHTLGEWIHHAWVVDTEDRAIEVTWLAPGDRYIGLALDLTAATRAVMLAHDGRAGPAFPDLRAGPLYPRDPG